MRRRRMLAVWMDQNFAGRSRPEQGMLSATPYRR
jgi:hypothetical protein